MDQKAPAGRLWNVPRRNLYFTGREDVLAALHEALTADGSAALCQAIAGLGGIGKTQTAVEYCHRHRDAYPGGVFWIRAETEVETRAGLVDIARRLGLGLTDAETRDEEAVAAVVRRWLETNDGWLLVFDNADRPERLKPYLPASRSGRLLLTSRASTFGSVGIRDPFRIRTLPPEEAQAFLLDRAGRKEASDDELAAVAELAAKLGYLPLALEQAGAYVAATRARFASYLKSYRTRQLELLEAAGPETGNYPASVVTTWSMSFAAVEKASEASADFLRVVSFLAPGGIPLEIFEDGARELGSNLADALSEDPLAIAMVKAPLLSYSFVEDNVKERTVSVHRLVQEVIRDRLDDEAERSWAERVVKALAAVFPSPPMFKIWPRCERLYPQVLEVERHLDRLAIERIEFGNLLNETGLYAWRRGRYEETERLFKHSLRIRKELLGDEHPDIAQSLTYMARLYFTQGKLAEAEPLYERSLRIYEKVYGEDHPHVTTDLYYLAELYRTQGRLAEAESLFERSRRIREKWGWRGPGHLQLAELLNYMALLYVDQGKLAEAEPLYERSLGIRERVLGDEHPNVAGSLNNLAELYRAQSRYEEAEPLYKRSLVIREKALGDEHPDVGTSLKNYALLLRDTDRAQEAEEMGKRAKAIRDRYAAREAAARA